MSADEHTKASRLDYIRVANYYYKAGLTQEEIAKNMSMSRQRVNRILGKCVELGIVKISIEGFDDTDLALETELEKKYGLKAARIATASSEENAYREIGQVAADYLAGIVVPGDIIGFSRGRNVSSLVDCMPKKKMPNVTVTQLMGGWNNQQSKVNVDDIVHRFSEKTDSASTLLYAPVVVNSPELRKAIMGEPFFYEAYRVIKACTIAVVGIGDATHEQGYPGERAKGKGAAAPVGEICTHYYAADGSPIFTPLDERVIAVELADFMRIPTRIGVAGMGPKFAAILGALRGGYVNALVTDKETADRLCALA